MSLNKTHVEYPFSEIKIVICSHLTRHLLLCFKFYFTFILPILNLKKVFTVKCFRILTVPLYPWCCKVWKKWHLSFPQLALSFCCRFYGILFTTHKKKNVTDVVYSLYMVKFSYLKHVVLTTSVQYRKPKVITSYG